MQYYFTFYNSPLKQLTLVSDSINLTHVLVKQQLSDLKISNLTKNDNLQIFTKAKNWLDKYFSKQKPKISELPLLPQGTEFQKIVWNILITIPYGQTTTYGSIAKIIEKQTHKRMSAQAVGGAVGKNPIPIIIPCHRVIGANSDLVGYSEGLDIKIKLLELENIL